LALERYASPSKLCSWDGVQPNLKACNILLNLLLLLLKDVDTVCIAAKPRENHKEKATKTKSVQIMFWSEVHAFAFLVLPQLL
jgi:hypothetical protein